MARILVIDDEEVVCRVFQRALAGHDVDTAGGGAEGVALHAAKPYDLAFVDLHLSEDVNGAAWAEVLMHACPLRVVLMTGDAESEPSPFEILRKPFGLRELEALIGRVIGQLV